jgi:hypothetical protein
LIAGGAIMGVVLTALAAQQLDGGLRIGESLGPIAQNPLVAMICYGLFLLVPLYLIARRYEAAHR